MNHRAAWCLVALSLTLLLSCRPSRNGKVASPPEAVTPDQSAAGDALESPGASARSVVLDFVRLWHKRDYAGMYALTVNAGERDIFVDLLARSVATCRNFAIEGDSQHGNDWAIEVSFEVSDPTSVIAVHRVAAEHFWASNGFALQPSQFHVETFLTRRASHSNRIHRIASRSAEGSS